MSLFVFGSLESRYDASGKKPAILFVAIITTIFSLGVSLPQRASAAPPEPLPGNPAEPEAARDLDETPDTPPAEESVENEDAPADVLVTATRREAKLFTLPYSGKALSKNRVQLEQQSRTLPEALEDVPSAMVQKTAHGQASPFLRGFTGYQTLFLIDGVRLNNSTFRAGPNQYTTTIDPFSTERIEVVLGPSSMQYGTDAVGGIVNAITRRRESFEDGFHLGGRVLGRYASAEDSFIERLEFEGNYGKSLGFLGGITMKSFGDLRAGRDSGELPNTAYDEFDADLRIDYRPDDDFEWTLVYQHASQDDVPRTHTTIFAVPFHGSTVGSELRRDHDQRRDLVYSRWTLDEPTSFLDRASFTLSFQRQEEKRDRLRSGDRRDIQGFDVNTYGAQLQFERDSSAGYWTFGADYYYDEIDSFRRNIVGGGPPSNDIQGALGDDATYGLFGLWVQDEVTLGGVDWIAGLRYTRANADADRVDNPEVPGSDPATPGNIISISDDYDNVVASLRGSLPIEETEEWRLFFGASQGFRAPSLSDLTAFESTSVFEIPTEDLDPERFLALELGVKTESERFSGRAAGYYTFIDDLIVRSPTGDLVDGVPVVRKDNVGDGHIAGIELDGRYRLDQDWSVFGAVAWQSGRVEQFNTAGQKVDKPTSRLMPLSGIAGTRFEPREEAYWVEFYTRFADDQDDLSLRDRTDSQRIPPGGTPGWATLNVRGGLDLSDRATLAAAVENITDKDYRVHGSGLNEPGTNVVVSLEYRF